MVAKINDLVDKKFFAEGDLYHLKQGAGLDKRIKVSDVNKASKKSFDNPLSGFTSTNMQDAISELSILEFTSTEAYFQPAVTESVTVGPGEDYENILDALRYFATKVSTSSSEPRPIAELGDTPYFEINLRPGWVLPATKETFSNVDLSHIRITGYPSGVVNSSWAFLNSKTPVFCTAVPETLTAVGERSEIRTMVNPAGIPGAGMNVRALCGAKIIQMDSDPYGLITTPGGYAGFSLLAHYGGKIISLMSDVSKNTGTQNLSGIQFISEAFVHGLNSSPGLTFLGRINHSGRKASSGNFYARCLSDLYLKPDTLNSTITGVHVYSDHGGRIRVPNFQRTGSGVVRSTFGSEVILDSTQGVVKALYTTQINNASKYYCEWKSALTNSVTVVTLSRASVVIIDANTYQYLVNIAQNTFTSSGLYIKET